VISSSQIDVKSAYIDSAVSLFSELNNLQGLGTAYNTKGAILLEFGDYEKAEEALRQSLEYMIETGNKRRQAVLLNNIAITYIERGKAYEAIENYKEAIKIWQELNAEPALEFGRIYFGLASANRLLHENEAAMDFFAKSFEQRSNVGSYAIAEVLIEMANLIFEAATDGTDTIQLHHKIKTLGFAHSLQLLDSAQAVPGISERLGFTNDILNARRKHALLYGNYKKAHDLLLVQKENNEKSWLSESNLSALADLKIKYEKDNLSLQLLKEEISSTKKQNQINFLLLFIGLMLLTLIIGLLVYQNRLKRKQLLLNKIEQEQQHIAMNAMLEGQESERAIIARDLHDGLGNLLSSIRVKLATNNTNQQNEEVYEMIDKACDDLREIAHQMMPQALKKLGLINALNDLTQNLNNTHSFAINVSVFGKPITLTDNANVMLFRIAQELLNNIIKYAQATEVNIQLTYSNKWLNFTIEDNGIGFDKDQLEEKKGMGLKSIAFRSEHLGGTLDIESNQNQGTFVSISVPIERNSNPQDHD
jgi:signal transduction histidine kinase